MTYHQAMIMLLLALAAQSAPVAPGPPELMLLEAAAIFQDNPIPEETKKFAIGRAVDAATYRAMLKSPSRYDNDKSNRLQQRILAHVPLDQTRLDKDVAKCAVYAIALELDLDEVKQVRRFMHTPAGSKFWQTFSRSAVVNCYQTSLFLGTNDEDYRAAGLKPPRRVKQKREKGNSVS